MHQCETDGEKVAKEKEKEKEGVERRENSGAHFNLKSFLIKSNRIELKDKGIYW